MKLLFNAAFNTRLKVGIAIYIRRLIPELARLCDLTILTPDPELFSPYGKTIRVPEFVRFNLQRTIWTLTCLNRYCAKEYDILLCPTPVVPIFPRLPTIAVVHDLIPFKMRGYLPQKEKLCFWLGFQSLRFARRVITVSEFTRKDLRRMKILPSERISVAYNGPGITPSDRDSDFGKQFIPFILYVGSHAPYKNTHRLIAAFSCLRTPREMKLILVGGDTRHQIDFAQTQIKRYNLKSRALTFSELEEDQLSSLYRHCMAFVTASLYEGFGLPLLEAMGHGAPIACSATSSLPEVANGAAVYFDPLSAKDIAAKLQLLLDNQELRANLSAIGQQRAAKFSWRNTARTIFNWALKSC
ncbi:MAG: glycosyltransferase family 4 protein [bacterium]